MDMTLYEFGTSGYRNNTENGFNETVVRQITDAISDYLIQQMINEGKVKPVLIGGDTREKSRRFIPFITQLLLEKGLDVYGLKEDVATPVLAFSANQFHQFKLPYSECAGAILMTASHNPWEYGGYNFLTPEGAVVPSAISRQFQELQQNPRHLHLDRAKFGLTEPATLSFIEPYPLYKKHLESAIGIEFYRIREADLNLFYDPFYATGRHIFPQLLNDHGIAVQSIHQTDSRPTHYTGMPNPSEDNLSELAQLIQKAAVSDPDDRIRVGLANDGDADRFGVLNEHGQFVSPSEVIALIMVHLVQNRQKSGVVLRSQATSHLIDLVAAYLGIPVLQTPVGYKYIAETFIEHSEDSSKLPILIGGEGSGGMSIGGHIPEKDGLLANLLILELVATEKRPLGNILEALFAKLPKQVAYQEISLKTDKAQEILAYFKTLYAEGGILAGQHIDLAATHQASDTLFLHYQTRDGVKLYLKDGSWVLVRASGTEPLLRVYVEGTGSTLEQAEGCLQKLLQFLDTVLSKQFHVALLAASPAH
jgi:phosphomannomutase